MPDSINPPDPPLGDGVVTLRPFRADDAPAVSEACQDPEIGRWIPMIPIPYTEAHARAFILMTLQGWHEGTSCEFAVVDAATDRLLGSVGVHVNPATRRHAIGYWVAAPERGRGVAVRAVRLAARWSFDRLGGRRLSLWTLPGNVASQRVAEKAGFRFEGVMRNWDEGRGGGAVDVVMFSMTPEDLAETEQQARSQLPVSFPEAYVAATPRELRAPGTRAAPFVEIAALADMAPGAMRRVTLAGLDLLVAWTPDGIVVTDDRCPHMSAPLSIGQLDGCVVACPLHEGRFDLVSGETVRMPTTGGLDAEGRYHSPWSPTGAELPPSPPTKKTEARRVTRVNRLHYYPARIRAGRLEVQLPILPE
jgi:RimJ/RimL family protein N-acetyltransferase/nitrite reductase/ring-hydroxylating ferredoxin subunit